MSKPPPLESDYLPDLWLYEDSGFANQAKPGRLSKSIFIIHIVYKSCLFISRIGLFTHSILLINGLGIFAWFCLSKTTPASVFA
jgi:hypothetical protein